MTNASAIQGFDLNHATTQAQAPPSPAKTEEDPKSKVAHTNSFTFFIHQNG